MATAVATPKPATTTAAEAVVGKPAAGFDIRRPFRYAAAFIGGTFRDALNLSSSLGRKGIWVGVGLSVLAFFSGAALPVAGGVLVLPVAGAILGLAAGAVAGLAIGAITGGIKGVARAKRLEDNAEQVAYREQSKPVRSQLVSRGPDYRDLYREHQRRQNFATDRIVQVDNESARDSRTYWTDMVDGSRHYHNHDRGGF